MHGRVTCWILHTTNPTNSQVSNQCRNHAIQISFPHNGSLERPHNPLLQCPLEHPSPQVHAYSILISTPHPSHKAGILCSGLQYGNERLRHLKTILKTSQMMLSQRNTLSHCEHFSKRTLSIARFLSLSNDFCNQLS